MVQEKKSPDEMSPKEQREFLQNGGCFVLAERELHVFALPGYGRYLLLNHSAQGWGGGDAIMYRLGMVMDAMERYATSGDLSEWEALAAGEAAGILSELEALASWRETNGMMRETLSERTTAEPGSLASTTGGRRTCQGPWGVPGGGRSLMAGASSGSLAST